MTRGERGCRFEEHFVPHSREPRFEWRVEPGAPEELAVHISRHNFGGEQVRSSLREIEEAAIQLLDLLRAAGLLVAGQGDEALFVPCQAPVKTEEVRVAPQSVTSISVVQFWWRYGERLLLHQYETP